MKPSCNDTGANIEKDQNEQIDYSETIKGLEQNDLKVFEESRSTGNNSTKLDNFSPLKVNEYQDSTSGSPTLYPEIPNNDFDFDFQDPGTWPSSITDPQRCFITKMRAENPHNPDLSSSLRDGRKLTLDWFLKNLQNGHQIKRSWLGYSSTKNALFCVPCRLFCHLYRDSKSLSVLAKKEGFTQWKKLSERIPDHENSQNHKYCFCSWKTLELSLGKGGLDKNLQDQLAKEESHWHKVLTCIVDAIMFLAKQGSPLRGSGEQCDFSDPRSGKFLNTIELISHYNDDLREHIERHKKGQLSYFSWKIQNEFLEIIAEKVRESILDDIKEAQYFSLIFDSTPDISHSDQMTEIIRYVKMTESGPEIFESFIDFFVVNDKTGFGLAEEILKRVKINGLDMNNCRGQSYDNGANMAGYYKGVQARILQEHKLAIFVPCAAHSLNLVGVHAAGISPEAQTFFGTVNCLYVFFSVSTSRWETLKKHVPLSVKANSKTRWSARMQAVEVIYKYFDSINKVLEELISNPLSTSETKTEANSLKKCINKFEFIVFTCFWFNILKKIDRVNQFLQRDDITVDEAVRHIRGLLNLLESTRDKAIFDAIAEAKVTAKNNNLPPDFKEKRKRKKKLMFDESCEDEISKLSEEDRFRISLLEIIDKIVSELNTRFQSLEVLNDKFGFLNGIKIHQMDTEDLKSEAQKLAFAYKQDICTEEFLGEIESFKHHALLLDDAMKTAPASTLLSLIHKHRLEEGYPNLTTALKIFLTLPVTVASGERSFSKLKIIKNYLRNSMEQNRLSNLSIISIEHKKASLISYDDIIKTFAAKKARKRNF